MGIYFNLSVDFCDSYSSTVNIKARYILPPKTFPVAPTTLMSYLNTQRETVAPHLCMACLEIKAMLKWKNQTSEVRL